MNPLDLLGWVGFASLMIFYWKIGAGRPATAYFASIFGSLMFLIVGIAMQLGYTAKLPSLIAMEATFIVLNIRALLKLWWSTCTW
jgi:hypothetical protein